MSSIQQIPSESTNPSNADSTGTFASLPRELDDMIWSQVSVISDPRMIEIFTDRADQTGEKRFKLRIKISGYPKCLSSNARVVILSHNRYMFDHKIINSQIVNAAKDVFMFSSVSQLNEYVRHTGAIINKTDAMDSKPACYPTMQNIVVKLFLDIEYLGSEPYSV
ncbi:hypothetical protein EAE96_009356 [Botrytis aclada]|nr:hypothetical protein EAE96_009356 [Botrytis aclada]